MSHNLYLLKIFYHRLKKTFRRSLCYENSARHFRTSILWILINLLWEKHWYPLNSVRRWIIPKYFLFYFTLQIRRMKLLSKTVWEIIIGLLFENFFCSRTLYLKGNFKILKVMNLSWAAMSHLPVSLPRLFHCVFGELTLLTKTKASSSKTQWNAENA